MHQSHQMAWIPITSHVGFHYARVGICDACINQALSKRVAHVIAWMLPQEAEWVCRHLG